METQDPTPDNLTVQPAGLNLIFSPECTPEDVSLTLDIILYS
jgi:hypothetical protein